MIFFKTFAAIAIIINALLVVYFSINGSMLSVVNLEMAAIGSVAILSATYFGYKKMIENKVAESQSEEADNEVSTENHKEEEEDEDEDETAEAEKTSPISAVTSSYRGYLFPLRLVAYGVFAVSFVYLSTSGSLEIAAFFAGLVVAPMSVLLAMLWLKKTSNEYNNGNF